MDGCRLAIIAVGGDEAGFDELRGEVSPLESKKEFLLDGKPVAKTIEDSGGDHVVWEVNQVALELAVDSFDGIDIVSDVFEIGQLDLEESRDEGGKAAAGASLKALFEVGVEGVAAGAMFQRQFMEVGRKKSGHGGPDNGVCFTPVLVLDLPGFGGISSCGDRVNDQRRVGVGASKDEGVGGIGNEGGFVARITRGKWCHQEVREAQAKLGSAEEVLRERKVPKFEVGGGASVSVQRQDRKAGEGCDSRYVSHDESGGRNCVSRPMSLEVGNRG
jgi:hypothetical protein